MLDRNSDGTISFKEAVKVAKGFFRKRGGRRGGRGGIRGGKGGKRGDKRAAKRSEKEKGSDKTSDSKRGQRKSRREGGKKMFKFVRTTFKESDISGDKSLNNEEFSNFMEVLR